MDMTKGRYIMPPQYREVLARHNGEYTIAWRENERFYHRDRAEWFPVVEAEWCELDNPPAMTPRDRWEVFKLNPCAKRFHAFISSLN
jgi:hypothetical protein